jgi:hypothetical protein
MHTEFWWGNVRERDHLEYAGVDGRIIRIKMDLQEVWCGGHGLDRCGSEQEQVAGTCKRGNVSSGSIKCGEYLD